MIYAILFDEHKQELNSLLSTIKDVLALKIEEKSEIILCSDIPAFKKVVNDLELDDFNCFSFSPNDGARLISGLRQKFPHSPLLIIVDSGTSPSSYIRPGIMASSILLRPFGQAEMRAVVEEFLTAFIKDSWKEDEVNIRLETKDGITLIPTDKIFYIEASAKKIYIRLKREDYGYYDTLENLEKELPEHFARCHRSYIVNLKKVRKYIGAENVLDLESGLKVPVSRSYKSRIREMIQ